MQLNIQCGVLIIGSLLWDGQKGNDPKKRHSWRTQKLKLNKAIHVFAPIRYGRLSGGNAYTMVFSKSCTTLQKRGTSFFIPCKVEDIKTFAILYNQAKFLSKAEGNENTYLVKGKKEKWCTIGLLFNPNFDKDKKKFILNKWKEIVGQQCPDPNDYSEYKIGNETSVLSEHGEILLPWINTVDPSNQDILNEFDLILATVTKPKNDTFPDAATVCPVINNDQRRYFFNNVKRGISTYLDKEILKKIGPKKK